MRRRNLQRANERLALSGTFQFSSCQQLIDDDKTMVLHVCTCSTRAVSSCCIGQHVFPGHAAVAQHSRLPHVPPVLHHWHHHVLHQYR